MPRHVEAYMDDGLAFVPISRSNVSIECGVAWQEHYENPAVKWLLDQLNYYLVEQPEVF